MIHLPASVRLYVATSPCVVQRSFDGLHALVNTVMQLDAVAGHLFVFANRLRDRVKILYWDRDGLGALLSGIDLSQAERRKRYRRNAAEGA